MYFIPFVVILVIALAIFFSPLLAVILLIVALGAIAGSKLGRRSAVEDQGNPSAASGQADVESHADDTAGEQDEGGIWGETWPEEREEEHR